MNKLLSALVKKYGRYHLRKGAEYAFRCPACRDTKYRMDVNLKLKVFHCFHCGSGGSLGDLFSSYIEYDVIRKAKPYKLPSSLLNGGDYYKPDHGAYVETECPLPKGFKKMVEPFKPKKIYDFFWSRKLRWDLYIERGWGYCKDNWKMKNRLIIPVYESGIVVCWIARSVDGKAPKELSPEAKISNKSHFLYNLDQIQEGDKVILVEGVFDCERLIQYGYKSVAVMGSHLSDIQIGKLLAKKPSKIWIMFDGDKAGREGSFEAYTKLSLRTQSKVNVITLSEGKDPDELTKRELEELISW